jgi:hypothetical protein
MIGSRWVLLRRYVSTFLLVPVSSALSFDISGVKTLADFFCRRINNSDAAEVCGDGVSLPKVPPTSPFHSPNPICFYSGRRNQTNEHESEF